MKSIITFGELIKKLNCILTKEQKRKSVKVFVIVFLSSLLELLGVSAILPFLSAIISPETLKKNKYIIFLTKYFEIHEKELIILLGVAVILVYLIKNIYRIYAAYVKNKYSAEIQKELSLETLIKYVNQPYVFFRNTNSSDIVRGIDRDTANVYNIINLLFKLMTQIVSSISIMIYLLYMDGLLAAGVIIVGCVCFCVTFFSFKGKMKKIGIEQRKSTLMVNKNAYEMINGIKEIKVLGRMRYFTSKFINSLEIRQITNFWYGFIGECPDKIIEMLCVSGFLGLVCIRIYVGINLETFIPVLGTFALGTFSILPAISNISNCLNSIVFFKPSLDSLYDVWKTIENQDEAKSFEENKYDIKRTFEKLELRNITYKYEDGIDNILEDVNLTITRGSSVALIGTSGAGKSTLADIILGVNIAQRGYILLDGVDIKMIPVKWSHIVGYVPQTPFLLDSTIRENVVFGAENITDDRVWAVLKKAQMYEFVKGLKKGLDTIVGERGVKFSGGQRQRLAIARALVYDPEIIVFDEATSALDYGTEKAVMTAVNSLMGEKTLIIIAHRLSTVSKCNEIYKVDNKCVSMVVKEEIINEQQEDSNNSEE